MDCLTCGSAAVTERLERTVRDYRPFRCRACGKQYVRRERWQIRTEYDDSRDPDEAAFPLHAGMNRWPNCARSTRKCVPRKRGDEPDQAVQVHNRLSPTE